MLTTRIARAASLLVFVGLFAFAAACGSLGSGDYPTALPPGVPDGPSAPGTPTPPSPPPTPGPIASFPTPARPAQIFIGDANIYSPMALGSGRSQLLSRYVFYEDSTFALQFMSDELGFFEYGGSYIWRDTTMSMSWTSWSPAGPWEATATLRGDTLRVSYNLLMSLDDFVDGTYVRAR